MKLEMLHPYFMDTSFKSVIDHKKILCIDCKTHIKHEILVEISQCDSMENLVEFPSNYKILKCINCGVISYQTEVISSEHACEDDDFLMSEYATNVIFPIRDEQTAFSRQCEEILPYEIYSTYEEVIYALNNEMPLLTALGLRTLLEQIIKYFGKSDDLGLILNEFEEDGYISTKQRSLLDEIRYLGNDAAHRADSKSRKDLILHLKVLENLIHQLFVYYKLKDDTLKKAVKDVGLKPSPRYPIPVVRETTHKRIIKKKL